MTKRKLRRLEKRMIDAKESRDKAYDCFEKLKSYYNECILEYILAFKEMRRGYK